MIKMTHENIRQFIFHQTQKNLPDFGIFMYLHWYMTNYKVPKHELVNDQEHFSAQNK